MNTLPNSDGLLILPRLRVQNANAISSPLTHGFPAMTAFLGLMWALARKLEAHDLPLAFDSVGVICHDFDEQVTEGGYVKAFRLTRNPLSTSDHRKLIDRDGKTATPAIVEEGRMHMEITLILGISGGFVELDEHAHDAIAQTVANELAGMRVAGGSVLPSDDWRSRPTLLRFGDDAEDVRRRFRHLRRRWLPGFALVCRDDLLHVRLDQLREAAPETTALDALLDLSRFNWQPVRPVSASDDASASTAKVEWKPEPRPGWIVPIPVGFGALSELLPAGQVQSARDRDTPFRFVESLYSIGQWVSPHRLDSADQLLWYASADPTAGLYRCRNDFASLQSA